MENERLVGFEGESCPDCGKPKSENVCCRAEQARLSAIILRRALMAKAAAKGRRANTEAWLARNGVKA